MLAACLEPLDGRRRVTRTATRSGEAAGPASADRVRGEAYLNKVLALSLGDKRLKFGRRKGIDEASFGNDEEEDLGAGQNRQLVSLQGQSQQEETEDAEQKP